MPLEPTAVVWERMGDVTVLGFVVSRVTEIDYAKKSTDELTELADRFGGKMLFSLGNVTFMSSVGISILVTFNQEIQARGGQLKVCDIRPMLREVFHSIELDKAIDLYHSKQQALLAFSSEQ